MNKFNRVWDRSRSAVSRGAEFVRTKAKGAALAITAAPAAMVAMSGPAEAQDGLGAAALAVVSGIESDVQSILMVLVGVVFLLVLFAYLKRAK